MAALSERINLSRQTEAEAGALAKDFAQIHGGKVQPVTMTREELLLHLVGPDVEQADLSSSRKIRLCTGLGWEDIKDATLAEVVDSFLQSMHGQVSFSSQCKNPCANVPCQLLVTKLIPLPTEGYFLELMLEVCPKAEGALMSTIIHRRPDGSEFRVGFGLASCHYDMTFSEMRFGESFKSASHVEASIRVAWPRLLPALSALHPPFFDQQTNFRKHPHSASSSTNQMHRT